MLARDQNDPDAEPAIEQVTAVFQREVTSLRVISYQDASGNVETISTTDEHPFYAAGRGWVAAADLRAGDVVTTPTGGTAVVVFSSAQLLDQPIFVYNIEVASGHTYFVEDGQGLQTPVWVHNTCGGTYGDVRRTNQGGEVHHLISDAVAKALKLFSRSKGPAIWMERADHLRTLSHGSSDLAKAYRALQKSILAPKSIEALKEALSLEIRDIRRLFGSKYNKSLLEMLKSLNF